jgi:hypothetical protein
MQLEEAPQPESERAPPVRKRQARAGSSILAAPHATSQPFSAWGCQVHREGHRVRSGELLRAGGTGSVPFGLTIKVLPKKGHQIHKQSP